MTNARSDVVFRPVDSIPFVLTHTVFNNMKWKREIPNKTEFMKINSFHFIEYEKLHTELVHEENAGKVRPQTEEGSGQQKEVIEAIHSATNNDIEHQGVKMSKAIEHRVKYVPAKIKRDERNDFFVQTIDRNVRVRTMSETITLTESKTDFSGSSPKRYTTKCFIKPITTPVWYTESLLLNINSNRRKYEEKVHFKEKLVPFRWSENMTTEVKTGPKCVYSDLIVPVDACDEFHYISLEPQQLAAKSTVL